MQSPPSLEILLEAAQAGGRVLKTFFGQSLQTTEKSGAADFKTKADIESEEVILSYLEKYAPNTNIYSEESERQDKGSPYTVVIDPLDGTNNFVLGLPNFSISIGLLENNTLLAGVIYAPVLEERYYAEKGKGAFRNNDRIQVNGETHLERSTIAHSCGYHTPKHIELDITRGLYAKKAKRVLSNWSVAVDFCLLASGRIEACISNGTELYDYAAGKLIALEAGAKITDLSGQPEKNELNDVFVISNRLIHEQVIEITKAYSPNEV